MCGCVCQVLSRSLPHLLAIAEHTSTWPQRFRRWGSAAPTSRFAPVAALAYCLRCAKVAGPLGCPCVSTRAAATHTTWKAAQARNRGMWQSTHSQERRTCECMGLFATVVQTWRNIAARRALHFGRPPPVRAGTQRGTAQNHAPGRSSPPVP